ACDPSLEMLRRARANGIPPVAVAGLPHLPFPNAAFDRVAASFVLSHIPSYRDGLREMIRVLRPGGKLGATAWSLLANPYRDLADEMARSVVGADRFHQSTAEWLPWEDYLADPAHLQAALAQAGLRAVT